MYYQWDNSVFIVLSTLSKPPDRPRSAGEHIIITYLSISGGTNARNIVQLRQLTELFVELLHALAVAHAVVRDNDKKSRENKNGNEIDEKGTPQTVNRRSTAIHQQAKTAPT
jgi:hypothetical protein